MEEKKENKSLIAIMFLSALVIVLSGYIIIDKTNIFKEKEIKKEEKEPVVETKKISESDREFLTKNIEEIYNSLIKDFPIENTNKIENQKLLYLAWQNREDKASMEFTQDEVDSFIKKYFGNNVIIDHEDLLCEIDNKPLYKYSRTTKKYTANFNEHGHGGPGALSNNKVLYVDGTVKDNIYTVNTKVFIGNYCGDTCGPNNAYYGSYEDSYNHKNPVVGDFNSNEDIILNEETMKNNKDKIKTTTYTFEKQNNGDFALISVK